MIAGDEAKKLELAFANGRDAPKLDVDWLPRMLGIRSGPSLAKAKYVFNLACKGKR